YNWRNENYPVASSEAGLHTWDNRLTDYSAAKIAERARHARKLLDQVRAMKTEKWAKDDRIDWLLFRAQLEEVDFGERVVEFAPMGEANYNYYLKHVLLLPLNAVQVEMLGRAELARYRALEALLPDPSMADPNPARAKSVPPDQEAFLKAYESREAEMIDFLKSH